MHAIVSDACRAGHTDEGAMNEAWRRVLYEWQQILKLRGDEKGVKYHLVLTVENP